MNSSGWMRSIMASNYDEEKFLFTVGDIIGREFETPVTIMEVFKGNFLVFFNKFSLELTKDKIKELKGPIGPYRLDKYILQSFMIQGFKFDKRRSQYIRYVFGIFEE
ncbi:hypothetical protein [Tissierella sp.]|uniref:hypothetical protein n=1 Tax=Tissierella sp. TaxID=41274 RepID=UPI0028637CAE|nr:hypothetical protein [Tissierella sp.]MDR7856504.1 hypothetical protein [Tissierella sp.]